MPLSPLIAVHTTFALCAVALGPAALWSRLGAKVRPRWHRAAGYAWVTCMLGAAVSAVFIPSQSPWRIGSFGPIHLLVVVVLLSLVRSFFHLHQGNIRGHRRVMQGLYGGACIVAGLFTLLPQRTLGLLLLSATGLAGAQTGMRQIGPPDMPITVLYPTDQPNQPMRVGPFSIEVAVDAAAQPGPRRLVVLSHGSAGSAVTDHGLARTLVDAGFVVAQPQHRGDNHRDFSRAGPAAWQTRPTEVTETINAIASDAVLAALVRTDRVGVHGMSAGGLTGLALAGGQWRLQELISHCHQHLDDDIGFCLNGLGQKPLKQLQRKAQFAMARLTPDALLPSMLARQHGGRDDAAEPGPDPRITAVSLLVPVAAIFTPDSLARIRIPVAITHSGADQVLLPRWHSDFVLKHCTTCTVLGSHPAAGHFDWLWPWPADVAQQVAAHQMRGGLPSSQFSPGERQQAFERIASFFKAQL